MKLVRFAFLVLFSTIATGSLYAQEATYFGKKIDDKGAISMASLEKELENKDTLRTKVTGTVVECCQAKGCWMTIDKSDGTTMRVKFKDYGFFVPKNSSGKTAIMEGTAMVETVSVDEQRHYAEDAGKSKAEIKAINKPSRQLVFVADGVILQ
ncbi:MAG: DUF4920 domain-containing protein [Chitinophagales bacterium]